MLEYWNNGFVNSGLMDEWANAFIGIKLKMAISFENPIFHDSINEVNTKASKNF
jgi:hypothetical protein